MEKLYAPWRSHYIKKKLDACPFCTAVAGSAVAGSAVAGSAVAGSAVTVQKDEESFVVARGQGALVMLNRYPYNAGHLLVIPHLHHAELSGLTLEARSEMMELATRSVEVLKKILKCDGINMGINSGNSSGGSIPEHLHMHVLPRWQGDTNFLATLGNTKLVSYDLRDMYEKLKAGF